MAEDFEDGISLREEVEDSLPSELVEALHTSMGAQRPIDRFSNDLIRLLTRYERYQVAFHATPKKERRAQLTKLRDKASQFIDAVNALSQDVSRAVETNLVAVTYDPSNEVWSFESDEPFPDDDQSIADAQEAAENIIAACQMELDLFDETKGAKRTSSKPALDQLLCDLAALYETETKRPAKSQCYRDELTEEGYNGAFFTMAKLLLDSYEPRSYGTPEALGIRILRVLADD
ncbi:hypothetical protein [Thalassovita mangrovi]|uniref:Uncharacterized protein n=1 Tax=Thalassovita mangrovi TaxID=2692236 RepID=A0A6L8LNF8_9RHOB|nr:hypothetical protein [Thalassovita mangrovi]MYM55192.1 hypothetical protein [Thalassovita mangrovi]